MELPAEAYCTGLRGSKLRRRLGLQPNRGLCAEVCTQWNFVKADDTMAARRSTGGVARVRLSCHRGPTSPAPKTP